ncbi:ABC transporter substrate-binding protein [Methylobacterium sp. W2]|uniref:ABC transporter substrate-binding protein n=1 Tax=Methylobacterium sp. W2 TaxID=2598107 RepID=UPI001D0CCB2E|nr:ABC transporter substrate-binding protein [Methylobacterium sp. W2]MCC0804839.1 ABC transporter substrate-binding protein [Methylobacterium sp. W2]
MTRRLSPPTAMTALILAFCLPAGAAEPVRMTLLTNRTGPGAAIGARVANGVHDYLEMLNQRDGGIGGVPLQLEECEVASEVERARACYAAARAAGTVLITTPDRGITQDLLAPAARDRIPLLSLADGFPAGTRGDLLPWVFNPSATVLGGITIAIRYLADRLGGLSELQGLSIGLVYSHAGADPSALAILQELGARYGFSTPLFADDETEAGNAALWTRIAAARPDHVILLGQGARSGASVEEALKVDVPPDRMIALRWPDQDGIRRTGSASRGFKEVSRHAFGDAFPAFDAIDTFVADRGLSSTPKDGSGETHYNRGVYNAVLAAEAIAEAQRARRGAPLRGEDVRLAFEGLSIDDSRWKGLGLAGFAHSITFTCRDHGGRPSGFVQVWGGAKWLRAAEGVAQMNDLVDARLDAVVADFRIVNPTLPARTEPCGSPP